jgi:hypothetical protein
VFDINVLFRNLDQIYIKMTDKPKLVISSGVIEIFDGHGKKHGEVHGDFKFEKCGNKNAMLIGLHKRNSPIAPGFYKLIAKVSCSSKNHV